MSTTAAATKRVAPEAKLTKHESDASVHLDAVRGLAALAVFLGHGRPMFLSKSSAPPAPLATSAAPSSAPVPEPIAAAHETIGHEAVIVFFVLSGYFVGGSVLRATRKGVFSWKTYLFQRLTRLWIVLIPALLIGWALDSGGMHFLPSQHNIYSGPAGQEEVGPELASRLTPQTFAGNLLFLQTIFLRPLGTNASLWSLSYEFWYYILFPFLLAMFLPSKRPLERIASGLLMAGMCYVFGLELSRYFLIWLFGVGVALLPLKVPAASRRLVTAGLGLVFIASLAVMLKSKIDLYVADVVLSTAFAAFLWAILHAERSTVNAYYRKAAQGLSNMSYTLYLVHMPFLALASALLVPEWHLWPMSARAVGMLLGVYAVVFAASWAMYFAFERNTERIRKRLVKFSS